MDIFRLAGLVDYRLGRLKGLPVYLTPLGPAADAALDEAWARLTDNAAGEALDISLLGRTLTLPCFARMASDGRASTISAPRRSGRDFLALAEAVDTLILDAVPVLGRRSATKPNVSSR